MPLGRSRIPLLPGLLVLLGLWAAGGCRPQSPADRATVVVYASQDQVYAEPILRRFEQETGIQVLPVFDSEAVKTVGLVRRLMAEAGRPRCDVFWSNEELRTHQLAARSLLRATHGWAAFGFRSRRLVINTNLLPLSRAPQSLVDLTNQAWRGKISMAYPGFGSTATHLLALRHHWGPRAWEQWCRALAANEPFLEAGNSHVPGRLARGEAWIGWTDSDDVEAARRQGLQPGHTLPLGPESLLIRNTVAVLRDAPHPGPAQKLFEYLQGPAVRQALVEAGALEGTGAELGPVSTLEPDWPAVVRDLEAAAETLKVIFLQ